MRPKPFFEVAPGVAGLRTVMVNLFFVSSTTAPNGWVLVDAGLRGCGRTIHREAVKRFGANNPPLAVVLTHGHFDHTGGLPWLLRRWNVPVYAHADELPYLNREATYPPPDPSVGGGLMARSSPLYPRRSSPLHRRAVALPANGDVPHLPNWKWIATPGHSPGHVSFWREADRVLISGDAVISTRQESMAAVWRQTIEVRPPPAYFTCDWQQSYDSMRRLRAMQPEVLASGHGLPLRGADWRRQFDKLLEEFPQRGLPRHGHYVRATWPEPLGA